MQNVYAVTYDIKLRGEWLSNANGWAKRNVLANGDVRSACTKLEKIVKREVFGGAGEQVDARPSAVRILKVERVASDILI